MQPAAHRFIRHLVSIKSKILNDNGIQTITSDFFVSTERVDEGRALPSLIAVRLRSTREDSGWMAPLGHVDEAVGAAALHSRPAALSCCCM